MCRYVTLNSFVIVLMLKAQVLNMLLLTHACTLAVLMFKDFLFTLVNARKFQYILVIPSMTSLTWPFANRDKKINRCCVYGKYIIKKDTAEGVLLLMLFCSFVKLYSCKEFSFFCKLILQYAVNEALPLRGLNSPDLPAVSLV